MIVLAGMDPWPFIWGAYAVALGGVGLLAGFSFRAMRRAERAAAEIRR